VVQTQPLGDTNLEQFLLAAEISERADFGQGEVEAGGRISSHPSTALRSIRLLLARPTPALPGLLGVEGIAQGKLGTDA
jgi:hypothetical protein